MGRSNPSPFLSHLVQCVLRADGSDAAARELNLYLEARLTDQPATVNRVSTLDADRDGPDRLTQTVAAVFQMASDDDRVLSERSVRDKHRIWEDMMTATSLDAGQVHTPVTPGTRTVSGWIEQAPRTIRQMNRRSTGMKLANAALAAILVLALIGGGWFTAQRFSLGGGGGHSVDFAATGPLDDPDLATPSATPDVTGLAVVTLPTAKDCTVTPLTVDEVMAILNDPVGVFYATQAPSTPSPADATVTAVLHAASIQRATAGEVSPEILDQVVAMQREWVACTMAGSYFQRWALEYPELVRNEIIQALPLFFGEEETRSLLTELEQNGTTAGFPELSGWYTDQPVELIDPDPATARYNVSSNGSWGMVWASTVAYNAYGEPIYSWSFGQSDGYVGWTFTSLNDDGPWLIQTVGGNRG